MSGSAPQLYTIQEILEQEDELPLLVQQRNGNNLLLHKSLRIPYVICQALEQSQVNRDAEYFLIPLDNKGYFGSVSVDEGVSRAHTSMGDLLAGTEKPQEEYRSVLTTSLLPVTSPETKGRNSETVLLPGSVLKVPLAQRCNLLQSEGRSFCSCLSGETEPPMTCCRHTEADGTTAHLHIANSAPCPMYLLSNLKEGLKSGCAYTIQDIAHSERIPTNLCCVYHHSSPRDDIPAPTVFRLIKIVSQRVVIAYRIDGSYIPKPENAVEILSQSIEKFALADSHSVNLDYIRSYKIQMSIKIARAGQTMDEKEFKDIKRRSSGLPPILPARTSGARRPSQISLTLSPLSPASSVSPQKQVMIVENIQLPERARPSLKDSILKRFHTTKSRSGEKRRPSLTEAISRLNIGNEKPVGKPQKRPLGKAKSLRNMEISRPIIEDIFHTKKSDRPTPRNSSGIYSCIQTLTEENKTMESELEAFLNSKRSKQSVKDNDNTPSINSDSSGIGSVVDGNPHRRKQTQNPTDIALTMSREHTSLEVPEGDYIYPVIRRKKRLSTSKRTSSQENEYF